MEDQEDILSQIVTALQEGLGERLVAVVLYGSRARDQAREASDWDLFIIAYGFAEATLGTAYSFKAFSSGGIPRRSISFGQDSPGI